MVWVETLFGGGPAWVPAGFVGGGGAGAIVWVMADIDGGGVAYCGRSSCSRIVSACLVKLAWSSNFYSAAFLAARSPTSPCFRSSTRATNSANSSSPTTASSSS